MTLGTRYRPAIAWGALRWIELVLVPFGDRVGTLPLRQARQWVRHGHDAGGGRVIQFTNQLDDARKAVDVDRDLGLGQRQSGQMGNVVDVATGQTHDAEVPKSFGKMGAKSYTSPCGMSCRLLDYRALFRPGHIRSRPSHVQTFARLFLERLIH